MELAVLLQVLGVNPVILLPIEPLAITPWSIHLDGDELSDLFNRNQLVPSFG
jgi:hypothetical protein